MFGITSQKSRGTWLPDFVEDSWHLVALARGCRTFARGCELLILVPVASQVKLRVPYVTVFVTLACRLLFTFVVVLRSRFCCVSLLFKTNFYCFSLNVPYIVLYINL